MCATVWPTRALNSDERWFDEIYFWTEGFQASTTQRARIQLMALEKAFYMLEHEHTELVGVTLSFGTIERFLDQVMDRFQAHDLVTQRIIVILRGSYERLRSPYRLRAFIDHLRAQQIPVGYRVTAPRITMEIKALNFLQPDFTKLLKPDSSRAEFWQDFVLETRVAGVQPEAMILAGLESLHQIDLARQVGIRFGQGTAVRPPYAPPASTPLGPAFSSAPAYSEDPPAE